MKVADFEEQWQSLMIQSLAGDEKAYRELLEAIYPVLVRFYIKKVASQGVAEDLTQECLIAIHKNKASWDPKRSFQAWLFAIARYKMIDYFRARERSIKTSAIDEERDQVDQMSDSTGDEAVKELVHEGLAKLPEEMKRAIVLTKLDGLSTEEAAEQENVSPGAMRVRISRAYKRLREIVESEI